MRFTQFKFPNGARVAEYIDRSAAIEKLADELALAGWSFEIEVHPDTQIVHMDCCDVDRVLFECICMNGPEVLKKVDKLVLQSYSKWLSEDKPQAVGTRLQRNLELT